MVLPLLGLAVLPIAMLWRLRLRRRPLLRALWIRLAFLVAMLVLAAAPPLFPFRARPALRATHRQVRTRVPPPTYLLPPHRCLHPAPPAPPPHLRPTPRPPTNPPPPPAARP